MKLYRHGDLLIRPLDNIPKNAAQCSENILAHGEATGHRHELISDRLCVFEFKGAKFIDLAQDTNLLHQEHKTLRLRAGRYKLVHERDLDLNTLRSQVVAD